MSYEPTVWAAGDVVTATKMNKIEQGISENSGGSNGLIVDIEEDGSALVLSERFSTIADIVENGGTVYIHGTDTIEGSDEGSVPSRGVNTSEVVINYYLSGFVLVDSEDGPYMVMTSNPTQGNITFVAATREDYPINSSSDDSQPESVS